MVNIISTLIISVIAVGLYEFLLMKTKGLSNVLFNIKGIQFSLNKILAMALVTGAVLFLSKSLTI